MDKVRYMDVAQCSLICCRNSEAGTPNGIIPPYALNVEGIQLLQSVIRNVLGTTILHPMGYTTIYRDET
ncbi:hypothetical protein BR10RB9215_C11730 [Brucella sp. 10RB9215]|nr:hypothetical protein BR10RB9215_C11730 [Brucella sp. 10RB9215]